MQFSTTTLFAIFAALAIAAPAADNDGGVLTSKQVQSKCGKGQKVSCCNGETKLLGANCVALPILSVIPITKQCSADNTVACCNTQQNGLINVNVACVPVNLGIL